MRVGFLLPLILLISSLFTYLFYNERIGLNFLIFELIALSLLIYLKPRPFKFVNTRIALAGTLLTLLSVVFTHSTLAIAVNFISLVLLSGFVAETQLKSAASAFGSALFKLVSAPLNFIASFKEGYGKGNKLGMIMNYIQILIVPLIIFIIFLAIYNFANPYFSKYYSNFSAVIREPLIRLFQHVDFQLTGLFVIGWIFNSWLFLKFKPDIFCLHDSKSLDNLTRKREQPPRSYGTIALKREYLSGVILLVALNVLLLIVNLTDIYHVWLTFEWDGGYLKNFVHEGTYLLIFSILISMALVLYFFRNNLNFYSRNRLLILLAVVWLAQNAILTISVFIRNFWYMNHFALAYKRIGVVMFLIVTLAGLYFIIKKIRNKKSSYFLIRKTAFTAYFVLLFFSLFNWDNIIADFNFSNYQRSFVHLDFLATLEDKSLPILDKSKEELKEIEEVQAQLFDFDHPYMTSDRYFQIIHTRKWKFIDKWHNKSWLSWNFPEQIAHSKLCSKAH